jgi:hypothetical protein
MKYLLYSKKWFKFNLKKNCHYLERCNYSKIKFKIEFNKKSKFKKKKKKIFF